MFRGVSDFLGVPLALFTGLFAFTETRPTQRLLRLTAASQQLKRSAKLVSSGVRLTVIRRSLFSILEGEWSGKRLAADER